MRKYSDTGNSFRFEEACSGPLEPFLSIDTQKQLAEYPLVPALQQG